MDKKGVLIFGVSKIAQVLYANMMEDKNCLYIPKGFCVDEEYYDKEEMFGLPVVKFEEVEVRFHPKEYDMMVAIGYHSMNKIRAGKCEEAEKKGYHLANFIHSEADISDTSQLGKNVVILKNASVAPFSVIGDDVFLFANSVVAHHSIVGAHAWLTSGSVIGGNSCIGKNCFVGINATIGHNVKIGNNNFIGAGAVVTKNSEDDSVFIVQDTPKYRLNTEQFMKLFNFD